MECAVSGALHCELWLYSANQCHDSSCAAEPGDALEGKAENSGMHPTPPVGREQVTGVRNTTKSKRENGFISLPNPTALYGPSLA